MKLGELTGILVNVCNERYSQKEIEFEIKSKYGLINNYSNPVLEKIELLKSNDKVSLIFSNESVIVRG